MLPKINVLLIILLIYKSFLYFSFLYIVNANQKNYNLIFYKYALQIALSFIQIAFL